MYIFVSLIYNIFLGIVGHSCSMETIVATGFGCVCLLLGFGIQDIISELKEIKKGRK